MARAGGSAQSADEKAEAEKAEAEKAAAEKAAAEKAAAEKAAAEKAEADRIAAEEAHKAEPAGEVTVTVAIEITGTRDGEPWPKPGEPITLPAAEAEDYLRFGYVLPIEPAE